MERKPNLGRQKIEIKKIEGEAARQVTFSKRRGGIFKKASELSILCGAEVAILVYSPAGKVYSFGHPSIETVIQRFLGKLGDFPSLPFPFRDINREYVEVLNQLEAEKKQAEMLKQLNKQMHKEEQNVWELDLQELIHLKASLEKLKKKLSYHVITSSPSSVLETNAVGMFDASFVSRPFGFGFERRLF